MKRCECGMFFDKKCGPCNTMALIDEEKILYLEGYGVFDTLGRREKYSPSNEWRAAGVNFDFFCYQAKRAIRVKKVLLKGRGYSGGHNTAMRLGWQICYPTPPKGTLLSWDMTRQGAFTGYYPATMFLVAADAQR